MFVVTGMCVGIVHAVYIEGKAVCLRNVVIGNNSVTRNVARLNLVTLTTPKHMQCAIVDSAIRPIDEGRIALPLRLHRDREKVFPIKYCSSPDIVRIRKAQAFCRRLPQFQIFDCDTLVGKGAGTYDLMLSWRTRSTLSRLSTWRK